MRFGLIDAHEKDFLKLLLCNHYKNNKLDLETMLESSTKITAKFGRKFYIQYLLEHYTGNKLCISEKQ